jgi:hypothetical protein
MKTLKNNSFLLKIVIVFSFMCLSNGTMLMAEEPSEKESSNQLIKNGALLVGGGAVLSAVIYAIYQAFGEQKERIAAYMRAAADRELVQAAHDVVG